MQKIFKSVLILFLILNSGIVFADEKIQGEYKPFSREFINWQNQNNNLKDGAASSNSSGYIPIPVDLSHLVKNSPVEKSTRAKDKSAGSSKYDLRDSGYVTSVKDQGSYGTCWAHASVGAMESNLLKRSGAVMDLSEQHLAWFTMKNSDKSKTTYNMNGSSFKNVMNHGGNAFMSTALYSRLAGPVNESSVPYGKQPSKKTPEEYTRVLRLREVFYLSDTSDSDSINYNSSARARVKQRIVDYGGVMASYKHDKNYYQTTESNGTSYYATSASEGHAILLIGWDDNYSASNFKVNPGMNGAWLAKNSWGTDWGTGGYFWISYNQNLTGGAAFVVEEADSTMKVYDYDPLGWCNSWGYSSVSNIYFANVFKSERNETLKEVGFYTPDNNINYEINVYIMSSMPSSSPIKGSSVSSTSGTIPCAGYHTVTLNTPVGLSTGQYFSVVVKFNGYSYAAVERYTSDYSPSAKIEDGSFFSYNGSNWVTGASTSQNACVKAFTVSGSSTPVAPAIITDYPPDGFVNLYYSSTIIASGSGPMTWSMSGNVPQGLSINSSTGEISGTPTKTGNFTFSVAVSNSVGSASKSFTMNIWNEIKITQTEFEGYYNLDFSETLKLSSGTPLSWSISGKLPKGLTLDESTGKISGTPKQTGTFTPKITAELSSGKLTAALKIVITKPVKPSVSISKFPDGDINKPYTATLTLKGTTPITLSASGYPNGLNFNASKGILSGTPTEAGTFTVKITLENLATEIAGGTPVTKNLKLKINAVVPVIKTPSALVNGICDEEYSSVQFETSAGTAPITWKATGLPKGMSLSEDGILSGTPTKAGTFNITLTASNSGGKTTLKVPLTILEKPYTSTKKLSSATTDKIYKANIVAKGTTPITWKISGLPSNLSYSVDSKGTTATITGTPTVNADYNLTVTLTNVAGTSTSSFVLTVNGVKPKITASLAAAKVGSNYTGSKISITGTKPMTISCAIPEASQEKFGITKLEDIGMKFTANASTGVASITGIPTIGVKSLPIAITATNSLGTVTKKISFNVTGVKPAFVLPDKNSTTTINAATDSNVSIKFEVTGTKNITFSMNNVNGYSLTQTGDRTAVVTGTTSSKAGKATLRITATNSTGKTTKTVIIQTTAKSSATKDGETSEASLNIIKTRTLSSLSRNLISELENKGYEIAAVLPEISVNESGMYEFDFIIGEELEAGKKLIWLAFPDKESSEDDEIAEFYDIEGAEIENVPEDHCATVSAWFNEGIIYSPIIAVKGD